MRRWWAGWGRASAQGASLNSDLTLTFGFTFFETRPIESERNLVDGVAVSGIGRKTVGARCGRFRLNARHPRARQEMLTCCPLFEKDRFQIQALSGSHLTDNPWLCGLMWHSGHVSVA